MIDFQGRVNKTCWKSSVGYGEKRRTKSSIKLFGLKTEKIEVPFIEMGNVVGELFAEGW